MALYTKTGSAIPTDAVPLSESDAINFQRNIMNSWKTSSDIRFFNYGGYALSFAAGVTGFYLNLHYRRKLKLLNYGMLSTYLPAVVVPTAVVTILHYKGIQGPILIDKFQCPICLEVRASLMQLMGGVMYPMLLTPLSSFMLATRYYTYNVPSLYRHPRSWMQLYMKFTKPIAKTIGVLTGFQILLAGFIAYKEMQDVWRVRLKLEAFERAMMDQDFS